MWEESIRLDLLASGVFKAAEEYDIKHDRKAFEQAYLDLRLEFPTLSEHELWQLIGLCMKLYSRTKRTG